MLKIDIGFSVYDFFSQNDYKQNYELLLNKPLRYLDENLLVIHVYNLKIHPFFL